MNGTIISVLIFAIYCMNFISLLLFEGILGINKLMNVTLICIQVCIFANLFIAFNRFVVI